MATVTYTDLLERAHELILEGWVKGYPHRYNKWGGESYCVVGAIMEARRNLNASPSFDHDIIQYLNDVLWEKSDGNCRNIMAFNDFAGTSLKDVSDFLMDVIEELQDDAASV